MYRASLFVVTFACSLMVTPDIATAQISFGVTRQNGVVTGGGFSVNGVVLPGATGVRLGINAGTSQLIGVQQFSFQSSAANRPIGRQGTIQTRRPTAGQFIKSARRFDVDKDEKFSRKELKNIGNAVIAELNRRKGVAGSQASIQHGVPAATPTAEEMVGSFVKRCLTFDKDNDEALNAAETKRMAAAFIRSLD